MDRNQIVNQVLREGLIAGGDRIRRRIVDLSGNQTCKTGKKSAYIMSLVAEDIPFPEPVVKKLQWFKKHYKYKTQLPFDQATEVRFQGMKELLSVFCEAYNMELINFEKANIVPSGQSSASYWNSAENKILITGKLSIITFLHEFAHAMGFDEEQARKWSLTLFKKVYPIAFEKLTMVNDATEGDFLLILPNPVNETVVTNGQVSSLDTEASNDGGSHENQS